MSIVVTQCGTGTPCPPCGGGGGCCLYDSWLFTSGVLKYEDAPDTIKLYTKKGIPCNYTSGTTVSKTADNDGYPMYGPYTADGETNPSYLRIIYNSWFLPIFGIDLLYQNCLFAKRCEYEFAAESSDTFPDVLYISNGYVEAAVSRYSPCLWYGVYYDPAYPTREHTVTVQWKGYTDPSFPDPLSSYVGWFITDSDVPPYDEDNFGGFNMKSTDGGENLCGDCNLASPIGRYLRNGGGDIYVTEE
jgi:hypothetical protein